MDSLDSYPRFKMVHYFLLGTMPTRRIWSRRRVICRDEAVKERNRVMPDTNSSQFPKGTAVGDRDDIFTGSTVLLIPRCLHCWWKQKEWLGIVCKCMTLYVYSYVLVVDVSQSLLPFVIAADNDILHLLRAYTDFPYLKVQSFLYESLHKDFLHCSSPKTSQNASYPRWNLKLHIHYDWNFFVAFLNQQNISLILCSRHQNMAPLSAMESSPRGACDLPESIPSLDKKKIPYFSPLARSGRKSLTASKTGTRSQRSVSFSSSTEEVLVAQLNGLSEEDFVSTWLTGDDYKQIKQTYKATARLMMRGGVFPEDDEHLCSRGLESKTKNNAHWRYHQTDRVRKSLLKAQDFQRKESLNDPLYLAELYAEYSRPGCLFAGVQGILDQEAAR